MIVQDMKATAKPAVKEGRLAFLQGQDTNPYRNCTQLAFDWEDGWEAEHIKWSRAGRADRNIAA